MSSTRGDNHVRSRRALLRGIAAATAAALWPSTRSAAAAQRGSPPPAGRRIDVHHHIQPPGAAGGGGGAEWTPRIAVEEMDRNNVAAGIGYPGPIPATMMPDQARRRAREWNEFGTRIGRDHAGRFGLFAALPMHDVDGALAEIVYALDVLKADGFGISTSYGDAWLGDARFRPVWEELHRRNAVVFVHPNDAPCCTPATLTYEKPGISGAWLEWPMNTARTIFSLIEAGVTREFPGVRFIFCHSGGVMPLLIRRVEGFTGWSAVGPEKLKAMFPNGLQAEFQKLYFEGAQGFDRPNFDAISQLVPTSHILFGTDYNRFPIAHTVRIFERLKLAPAVRRAIEYENAAALLPRWKRAT
jgi:predicted TIM-barrel fold metal-dependent hydrolase